MKIKLFITGIASVISCAAFAQKGELSNAKDNYEKYNVARSANNNLMQFEANKDLSAAKTSIDKAAANEKTANLPATWAYKGAIYASLASKDTVDATQAPLFKTADEALQKAKSLDSVKQENKTVIDNAFRTLSQIQFNKGRAFFQNKQYAQAYTAFEYYRQVAPNDTTALFATGLSAANAGTTDPKYNAIAITNYNKLLTTNYSQNPAVYNGLVNIYLNNKDTTTAMKIAGAGVEKYPLDKDMRNREIQIGLMSGRQNELVTKIESAIAADPKNKTLYYYEGITYSQIAEAYAPKIKAAKDGAAKAALNQKKNEYYGKAVEQYKKALAIDPEDFESNLHLGIVLVNMAVEAYNDANHLPANAAQKEYDADMSKANNMADLAKPYLQKAVDLNPKSVDALSSLKNYYVVKKDMVHANEIIKKLAALGN